MHYALLAWGTRCHKIELLQKKALRIIFSKSPIAHTEPLLKKMNQPKLFDLYIINLLKLYYKLYRNRLPTYFECFWPKYRDHRHNLRNDLIRLPIIRCKFEEINTKYQMHRTLRDLASHGNSVLYPNIQINDDTLGTSYKIFSIYLKSHFVNIIKLRALSLTVLYVRTLTDVSYFSPLFSNHNCMHFKLTACSLFLFFFSFIILPIFVSYTD